MKPKKSTKLALARKQAFVGSKQVDKLKAREFNKDLIKHYIRTHYWKPRVERLIRARDSLKSIKYLSLCATTALDARLFIRERLIDTSQTVPIPFVYCEENEEAYQILQDTVDSSYSTGFHGKIEDIATNTNHKDYGNFWSTFPRDIINLDFWGDIHQARDTVKNIFYAIQTIISHQALLREPYELWITWRAKPDRVANNIQKAYQDLIEFNKTQNTIFAKQFNDRFQTTDLPLDDLVLIGFIKWMLYVANKEFSVIDKKNTDILVYTRKDKDGNSYLLYNFLMRISPYETITIPSPACEAATYCKDKYKSNVTVCFNNPNNIDNEYKALGTDLKRKIRIDLASLLEEYERAKSGTLR